MYTEFLPILHVNSCFMPFYGTGVKGQPPSLVGFQEIDCKTNWKEIYWELKLPFVVLKVHFSVNFSKQKYCTILTYFNSCSVTLLMVPLVKNNLKRLFEFTDLEIKIPLKRDPSGPEGIALGSLWNPLVDH